jgi:DNA-binding MarR family transcriptional regulator
MGTGRRFRESVPFTAQLSQLLVAFTIEFDNEFEHQMPHRTTRHGSTPGSIRPPWLVSMAMWVHCMRFVPEDGITVGELGRRSHLSAKSLEMVLKRMSKWWGYLVVEPDPADVGTKPPHAHWLVRPTDYGRQAQRIWSPLSEEIEQRWRVRFGARRIEQLRVSLWDIVKRFDFELPDYLPLERPRLEPATRPVDELAAAPALPTLLSKALLTLALDFESESDLSLGIYTSSGVSRLAISANILRVLDGQGVRVAAIPVLTGVAKMSIDNWLRSLDEHRYVDIGPDPTSRFKLARLTPKGLLAQERYLHWADTLQMKWRHQFGSESLQSLLAASSEMTLDSTSRALLWRGMEPYADGWRAEVRQLEVLPHHPVVSHRGGFPDGS